MYMADIDIQFENIQPNKPVIIAFSGLNSRFAGISIFEFKTFLYKYFDCNFIFCKDSNKKWYFKGLAGYSSGINDTVRKLKSFIQEHHFTKVITLGNSCGGFAALLFGNLLAADDIIAFSPQTFIDDKNKKISGDARWASEMSDVEQNALPDERHYLDIHNLQESKAQRITIVFGLAEANDCIHAYRMNDWANVRLIEIPNGDHHVVKELRDNGELLGILQFHLNQ
jgi:hypothetical protein